MTDVVCALGSGYAGEDALVKAPWLLRMQARVHVASRVDPVRHFRGAEAPVRGLAPGRVQAAIASLRDGSASFSLAHDHPAFAADAAPDAAALEAWLGTPFGHLAAMDRRFFDRRTGRDARDPDLVLRAAAAYTSWARDLLGRVRPAALLTTLEDDLFSVVLQAVAQRMEVPVLAWVGSRFPRRGSLFSWDFRRLAEWSQGPLPGLDEIRAGYGRTALAGSTVLDRTRGYWDLRALPRRVQDAAFAGRYNAFRRAALAVSWAEAAIVPPLSLWREAGRHALRVGRRGALGRLVDPAPPQVPYAFFPLHYLEDAQVTFREPFLDQAALVQAVARALPVGMELRVKSHPHYAGTDVAHGELRRMAATPRVRILPPEAPPGPVLEGARLLVTVNTTTGVEALLRGVPVVALGHDIYCDPALCVVPRDLNDLPAGLLRAARGEGPDPRHGQEFVRRAYANTVWMEGEDFGYGFRGVDDATALRLAEAADRLLRGAPPSAPSAPAATAR